jgi:hypothetical protein
MPYDIKNHMASWVFASVIKKTVLDIERLRRYRFSGFLNRVWQVNLQ